MKSTIALEQETIAKLKKQWKHADDTYDSVINRLLTESPHSGVKELGNQNEVTK